MLSFCYIPNSFKKTDYFYSGKKGDIEKYR